MEGYWCMEKLYIFGGMIVIEQGTYAEKKIPVNL
jgi:hypothetical protein